ncbi:MAG: hypothetical protein GY927_16175 [bacterium]|nr:hypothetical protein [bacterium]
MPHWLLDLSMPPIDRLLFKHPSAFAAVTAAVTRTDKSSAKQKERFSFAVLLVLLIVHLFRKLFLYIFLVNLLRRDNNTIGFSIVTV